MISLIIFERFPELFPFSGKIPYKRQNGMEM